MRANREYEAALALVEASRLSEPAKDGAAEKQEEKLAYKIEEILE